MSIEKIASNEKGVHNNVEDVIAHTERVLQLCMTNPESPGCEPKILHDEMIHTEVGHLLEKYEKHDAVRIMDLTETIERVSGAVTKGLNDLEEGSEDYDEAVRLSKLLEQRDVSIKRGVRRYVNTLRSFFMIKKKQSRLDPQEYREELVNIDRQRRIAHDGLIEALRVYADTLSKIKELGFLENFTIVEWSPQIDMIGVSEQQNILYSFSKIFLDDREIIKDWAVCTHFYTELQKIIEKRK